MTPPIVTKGAAKEFADLSRDAGNSLSDLTAQVLETYLPQIRFWAANNLYKLKDKLDRENSLRQQAGKRPIPIRFALPALARVAEEEDEELLTMWARLFANLQDPDRRIVPNKIYIHVLSGMEPLDVEILKHTVDVLSDRQVVRSPDTGETIATIGTLVDALVADLNASEEQISLSLHNLARLGCFRGEQNANYTGSEPFPEAVPSWMAAMPVWPWIGTSEASFHLTSLGCAIVEACRGAGLAEDRPPR